MIVTRFAPSPTGYLHIGGLRTALLSYLWARRNNGKFLLRIEDTDFSRNDEAAARAIVEAFKWVGLEYDGVIEYQSSRLAIYQEYLQKLLDSGKAYKCYMSREELDVLREEQMARKERAKYDNRYRDFTGTPPEGREAVIRIKAPLEGSITVHDGVKGDVVFNVEDILDDFIIARADGTPTYNFVVAVDDALMGVTDVIRGDDHLSNTPKQIVVYEALGFPIPRFFHVPMIHNHEGKKLSKRDKLCELLEFHGVMLVSHDKREILLDAIKERSKTLVEMANQINEILVRPAEFDETALKKGFKEESPMILKTFAEALKNVSELHLPSDYHHVMEQVVGELQIGFGKIGQPLRIALMGKLSGPGLDTVMAIIGVDETLARIDALLKH
ncbi:glutamate--tRNA ligase [Sulfuricurvum sp.]|uniref:glutamate--tRNA ligase n=1 Tax=Sulfuricurvum sp. TaxID=2025608 RepID=UPI0019A564EF|nr:glutamate--tRNA ligase [Sulfuricurvum sp.]MBD3805956.1 glutamate--tRNA ligase [Sulfuricurvum sp.]